MLQEKQRITQVSATATSGECTYDVNYTLNGSKLTSLNCGISRRVVQEIPVPGGGTQPSEQIANIGNMTQENGIKHFNFSEGEDIMPHVAVFDQIMAEVQETKVSAVEKKIK